MPRKGMRSLFFSPKHPSSSPSPSSSSSPSPSSSSSPHSYMSSPSRFGFSPSRPSFSESMMSRSLDMTEPLIRKWDPDTTDFGRVTSLFYENRREARDFLKAVKNLQRAMRFIVTENSNSEKLLLAQTLMEIAMKRLQKEFYQILSMNRAHLDPESVSIRSSRTSTGSITSLDEDDVDSYDEDQKVASLSISEVEEASDIAMSDLRLIAECMISTGYAKECLNIYKTIRKSIVDEAIYRLGVEKFSSSKIHKMEWEAMDLRITDWLNGIRTAVKTLFDGERILCDYVFASSDSMRESCFTEITKEGAMILFGFPANVAKSTKKSPEKIFRSLDMYTAICDYWPEIESIFSFESTEQIKSQALTSLTHLGEFVRASLSEFESVILKDSSKSLAAGAGIHDLTTETMEYLSILADYSNILSGILAEGPPPAKTQLPESYFGFSDAGEYPAAAISVKMAWLILVLLCKLDAKAKHYRDVSLSYLFLANNLQHVIVQVRSSNLRYILGDDWLKKHETKVKQFAASYERLGWGHVINSLPFDATTVENPEKAKEIFKKFNTLFDQAYKKQSMCVVPDRKLRDDIKVSVARKLFNLYREFYTVHRPTMQKERNSAAVVRYAPEDVGHHLSDLFFGIIDLGGSSSFSR